MKLGPPKNFGRGRLVPPRAPQVRLRNRRCRCFIGTSPPTSTVRECPVHGDDAFREKRKKR